MVRVRAEDAVKKIIFCREIDCSLEATLGQSVPQEIRKGSAARYIETCWQCVPRAPSSNPLTYKFHLEESVTSEQRCRRRAKRNPQRSLNDKGHLGSGITDDFCFSFIFPLLHLPRFLRWTQVSAVVWSGEKTALFLDLWVACQRLKDALYPVLTMLPVGLPKLLQAGLQSTAPPRPPSCPLTQVSRLSLTPSPLPPSVLPGPVPIEGTAFHRPHTEEDGETVYAQCTHVELCPSLTAHLWASPSEKPRPGATGPGLAQADVTPNWCKHVHFSAKHSVCFRQGTHCLRPETPPQQHDEGGLAHVLLGGQASLPPLHAQVLDGALQRSLTLWQRVQNSCNRVGAAQWVHAVNRGSSRSNPEEHVTHKCAQQTLV